MVVGWGCYDDRVWSVSGGSGMFATVIVVGQAEGKFKRPSSEHCWLDQALVLLSLPFDEL